MKTVYIHIGNFKTGTSAIQSYCAKNRKLLLANGINYLLSGRPRGSRQNHAAIPLSLLTEHDCYTPAWYRERTDARKLIKTVAAEIAESGANKCLISSEEFYRIAGLNQTASANIMSTLADALAGNDVRIIMYVKSPLEFLKSWYNQANKSPLPTRRFTDFVYHINNSILLPSRNANLWRNYFGETSLTVEPYSLSGSRHLERFLELLELDPDPSWAIPNDTVNPKRNEDDLELDRIAKVLTLRDEQERKKYLTGEVQNQPEKLRLLEKKILKINNAFNVFCEEENIAVYTKPIKLAELQRHEELVNGHYQPKPGQLRKLKARLHSSDLVARTVKLMQS